MALVFLFHASLFMLLLCIYYMLYICNYFVIYTAYTSYDIYCILNVCIKYMHVFVTLSTKFTSAESVHKNHRILVSVFVYHRILVRVVQKKSPNHTRTWALMNIMKRRQKLLRRRKTRDRRSRSRSSKRYDFLGGMKIGLGTNKIAQDLCKITWRNMKSYTYSASTGRSATISLTKWT